jgi:hypothetical protein
MDLFIVIYIAGVLAMATLCASAGDIEPDDFPLATAISVFWPITTVFIVVGVVKDAYRHFKEKRDLG